MITNTLGSSTPDTADIIHIQRKGVWSILTLLKLKNWIISTVRPYSSYVAVLTQSGTAAPTATILLNELSGTPAYAYTGVGTYTITLAGTFTASKTFIMVNSSVANVQCMVYRVSADAINIDIIAVGGAATNNSLTDTVLEIRVYA